MRGDNLSKGSRMAGHQRPIHPDVNKVYALGSLTSLASDEC